MANWGQSSRDWQDPEANKLPETVEKLEANNEIPETTNRKKVVVVGLGMVGIAFMYVEDNSKEDIRLTSMQRKAYEV
jgi:hypothetical protein